MLSNRKFVQHDVARQQRLYEESIRNAKPHPDIASLDFSDPIKCPRNRRKELMIERRNKEIEFENEMLQKHLLDIKKHESARPPKSPIHFKPKSMNLTRRKAEYEKINKENAMFLKELQNVKPQYSYKEDMKSYELTKKYLEVSSARGYNPYFAASKKQQQQQQQSPRSLPPLSGRKNENSQNPQPPKNDKSKSYRRKVKNENVKKEEVEEVIEDNNNNNNNSENKEKNEETKPKENEIVENTEKEESNNENSNEQPKEDGNKQENVENQQENNESSENNNENENSTNQPKEEDEKPEIEESNEANEIN